MAVTITLPDALVAQLAERGIRGDAALNQYAVTTLSASLRSEEGPLLEPDTTPLTDEDRTALDEAFADIDAGRVKPLEDSFAAFFARHGINP